MIIQDGRERALECEDCPEQTDPFDKDDFKLMIETARKDGWRIVMIMGEWKHYCPDCFAGYVKAKAGL